MSDSAPLLDLFSDRFFARFPASGLNGFPRAVCIPSLTGSADTLLALTLASKAKIVLAITPGIPDAERLAEDLRLLSGKPDYGAYETRILEFPPPLDSEKSSVGIRLKTLAAIRAWSLNPHPAVVVAPYAALLCPVPRGTLPGLALSVLRGANGQECPFSGERQKFGDVCARIADYGYNRVTQVEEEGDYSIRGGIVDVWSPGDEFPVRVEFFGDDLESLRRFNAATQTSVDRIDTATLLPVEAKTVDADTTPHTILDELPADSTVLALEHNGYRLPTLNPRPSTPNPRPSTPNPRLLCTGEPAPQGVPTVRFQTTTLPGFSELGAEEAHHPELFDAARARLERHLAAAKRRGDGVFRIDGLSGGFEIAGTADAKGLLVVTKADRVFTKRKSPSARGRFAQHGPRLNDFDDLEPGEYVVHVDYGVGRFIGSSEIVTDGKRSEVFTIEYADGAKLHVPAAHAHLLSRYVGVRGEAVRLHRLDGKRWDKDRKDAQKAVADLAAALLETQARRAVVPGFAYDVRCDGLDAFEAAFPYEETPDQAAAIAAVKRDLADTKPMDRLICGDAGYGKTEVAMRAAYIAAMNGRQTAVLAPTTVLAEQHFETFTARFDGTPVRIESMSRFQSAKTHGGTFARLANGACDIVIGTHALLSHRAAFRDLGLIVIDEEQRFGVRHKEFLKRLRATADVLTLSATPIPRTLYLSMTGARDLSVLRTPPHERVAVDTKVVTDSDEVVRAAIESERARGGQVFFLHNRVMTIGKVEKRLKEICPEAKTVVAHGQMDAATLARKMRDFERGDYDILLSTTIIESGIDIPRANTIVVDHAETFGLADLYQLRGRVGRSSRQGRALFLLPTGGLVDSDARERLKALQRHGGLGGGFNLAMRDLELRGAGNLLGSQQSGHIAAVGFSLYCQLLQRTIALLKGERVKEIVDVRLNLDFLDLSPASEDMDAAAALPYAYVEDDAHRMGFMKRFAEANDLKAVTALSAELADRFGPLPPPARRLVKLAELRVRCARAGIGIVDAKDARAIFYRGGGGSREIAFVRDLPVSTADRKLAALLAAVR